MLKKIDLRLIKLHKTTEPNDFNFPFGNAVNFLLDNLLNEAWIVIIVHRDSCESRDQVIWKKHNIECL